MNIKEGACDWVAFSFQSHSQMRHNDFLFSTKIALALIQMALATRVLHHHPYFSNLFYTKAYEYDYVTFMYMYYNNKVNNNLLLPT